MHVTNSITIKRDEKGVTLILLPLDNNIKEFVLFKIFKLSNLIQ